MSHATHRRAHPRARYDAALPTLRDLVAAVPDPELPDVTIGELGILRSVEHAGDRVVVTITPTYSGCPALDAIRSEIERRLAAHGERAEVRTVLSPAWTTDWITESGRRKLAAAGIAPPLPLATSQTRPGTGPTATEPTASCARAAAAPALLSLGVCCPRCGSFDTREISRFGSTPCKAHHVCDACKEPFDHVKAI